MSLSKRKCWYSSNCLPFLKCAVPLSCIVNVENLFGERFRDFILLLPPEKRNRKESRQKHRLKERETE